MSGSAPRLVDRGVPRTGRAAAFAACVLWAGAAAASFNGPLGPLNPGVAYAFAAAFALPTALACVATEAVLPRRHVPLWLTVVAGVAAAVMIALAIGVGATPAQLPGQREIFWFVAPPVATLALRGAVSRPLVRLAVGLAISIASVKLGSLRNPSPDTLPILAGGATACSVLWVATVLLLRAMRWAPPASTDAAGSLGAIAAVLPPADRSWLEGLGPRISEWFEASLSRRRGLGWWLATAIVLYVGIGAVISLGGLRGGLFIQGQVWAVTEFLRMPQSSLEPARLWWMLGLPWSLLVAGAAWGVAGVVGGFDPGRLRVLRLPVIVLGGLLLLWTVYVAWNIHVVWSAEEAATSGSR